MTLLHIRALAEEYARKYNPDNLAPFPYEHVLQDHPDLKVYFTELDDVNVSGVVLHQDGEFSVLVNISKSVTRQHFTLAHALGHYFLHANMVRREKGIIDSDDTVESPDSMYRLAGGATQQLEVEANNFALSLLMPTDLVRRAWEATESIEDSARIFNVSPIAMTIRLMQLGILAE